MHALVLNGAIIRTENFNGATPPTLAPNKGTWREVVDGTPPAFDPATHRLETGLTVAAGIPTRTYEVVALPAPEWDPLTFLERFTQAERIAIRQAAAGVSSEALQLADWLDMLRAARTVVADDPRTVAGMAALVAAGLLTAGRRDEILGV